MTESTGDDPRPTWGILYETTRRLVARSIELNGARVTYKPSPDHDGRHILLFQVPSPATPYGPEPSPQGMSFTLELTEGQLAQLRGLLGDEPGEKEQRSFHARHIRWLLAQMGTNLEEVRAELMRHSQPLRNAESIEETGIYPNQESVESAYAESVERFDVDDNGVVVATRGDGQRWYRADGGGWQPTYPVREEG